jgi:hypothetical protein
MPKRMRERECQFNDGKPAPTNHESGNCPFSDKIETQRQTLDNYTKCVSPFENITIDEEIEIETKVIVDFVVEIYEEWTPELEDPNSDAFTDLAEIYILGFMESLKAIDNVDGTSQIQFATVRVKKFTLEEEDFVAFRRRRSSLAQDRIKAEFETVFDIVALKDDAKETNIIEEAKNKIDSDISTQVGEQILETVERQLVKDVEDHVPGELNFIRIPKQIVTSINFEKKVLAEYSDHFIMDCNCEKEITQDYHECIATDRDAACLDGPKKYLEMQGPCSCAKWTSWSENGNCSCDELFQNCQQDRIRECQPAGHWNEENGKKWSINATTTCEGNNTIAIPCSGIYGLWGKWSPCDKTCVNKDEQSTRVRHRSCNDTTISGEYINI